MTAPPSYPGTEIRVPKGRMLVSAAARRMPLVQTEYPLAVMLSSYGAHERWSGL
jgi:hypothetical protein